LLVVAVVIQAALLAVAGCSGGQRRAETPNRAREGTQPHSATPSAETAPAPLREPVTGLAELESLALERHGDLERLRLEARAFEESVSGARSWPDPRLSYRESIVEVETRVGPQERAFGIDQMVPWPGLLDDRAERAQGQAAMASFEWVGARRAVLERLRTRWAEYYFLGRAIAVRRESLALLGRLESAVRDRLAGGRGTASAVYRTQVEIARVENEISTLEERAPAVRAALLAQVDEPPERAIPFPAELVSRDPDVLDIELLRELRAESDPAIGRATSMVGVAEADLALAGWEGWPKFGVGAQTIITGDAVNPATPGSGDDAWMVGIQVELPIDRRRVRSAERAARSRRDAALAALRQLERDRAAAFEDALFLRGDAERRVRLHTETLIPKAEEALRSTEAALSGGEADLTAWIDAERVLLELRLSLERAHADRLIAAARLRAFVGEDDELGPGTGAPGSEGP